MANGSRSWQVRGLRLATETGKLTATKTLKKCAAHPPSPLHTYPGDRAGRMVSPRPLFRYGAKGS
jgi:hypothetical protein